MGASRRGTTGRGSSVPCGRWAGGAFTRVSKQLKVESSAAGPQAHPLLKHRRVCVRVLWAATCHKSACAGEWVIRRSRRPSTSLPSPWVSRADRGFIARVMLPIHGMGLIFTEAKSASAYSTKPPTQLCRHSNYGCLFNRASPVPRSDTFSTMPPQFSREAQNRFLAPRKVPS